MKKRITLDKLSNRSTLLKASWEGMMSCIQKRKNFEQIFMEKLIKSEMVDDEAAKQKLDLVRSKALDF